MGIGKAHARGGEAIDVRRRHLRLRIIAAHVAIAEIVGEDQEHVGLAARRSAERAGQQAKGDQGADWGGHAMTR